MINFLFKDLKDSEKHLFQFYLIVCALYFGKIIQELGVKYTDHILRLIIFIIIILAFFIMIYLVYILDKYIFKKSNYVITSLGWLIIIVSPVFLYQLFTFISSGFKQFFDSGLNSFLYLLVLIGYLIILIIYLIYRLHLQEK